MFFINFNNNIMIFGNLCWGLGIGDWAQSPIPNTQTPIPNPQYPIQNRDTKFPNNQKN
jgi:hypothetical protein